MTDPLPLANWIALGAGDFGALCDCYRRAGRPQVMDDSEFAVFELRGIVLAPFSIDKLARDGNTEPEASTAGTRFTIGVQGRQRRGGGPADQAHARGPARA